MRVLDQHTPPEQALGRVDEVRYAEVERPPASANLPEATAGGLALRVEDLTFAFPDATHDALDRLSFSLEAGATLGVFGLTGSGKSTLLNLLSRVYDPPPGTVFVGDVDVTTLAVEEYWSRVAYVTQEPFLFSRSVGGNIALASHESEVAPEEVLAAAEDAALAPDLDMLPSGLDTRVGERGITLSGGQKQRTALARAFFRSFDLLLLDDVLSAVDHETEKTLIGSIYRRAAGATMLLVSHRCSVLAQAERIVVLEEGKIRQVGSHAELILDPTSPYTRAWRLQQAESEGEDG